MHLELAPSYDLAPSCELPPPCDNLFIALFPVLFLRLPYSWYSNCSHKNVHVMYRYSPPPVDCRVQSDSFHSVRLYKLIEIMASTGQSKICIFCQEFSLNILYLEGKNPLLVSNIQVNFGDILPETSKSSAFWDMGMDSH